MHQCPKCEKRFDKGYIVRTNSPEPFVADHRDLFHAMTVYGTYNIEKEVICHEGEWLHFRFLDTGEERLVKMVALDEDEIARLREENLPDDAWECQHGTCGLPGEPYYRSALEVEVSEWLCGDHAHAHGFCYGCGQFLAGFESFDMSKSGLCEGCEEEM